MTTVQTVKIAPSILAADFAALGEEIRAVEAAGADWIHLDVMDNHFVPNLTFGPPVVAALKPHIGTVCDVHLMIEPFDSLLEPFAKAGADVLTIHAEATHHLDRALARIRELGCRAGVALNPATPADVLRHVLDKIDLICVMTVNPGFGGQKFLHSQVEKLSTLRDMTAGREILIEIDGGVTPETAPRVARADVLVAGSAVFGKGRAGYAGAIAEIRAAAEGAR